MREIRFLVILAVLMVVVLGCVVHVHQRSQRTIDNLELLRQGYVEDIARAAGKDDPSQLVESDFPVGKLTWVEYQSTLGLHDSSLFYEQQKKDLRAANNEAPDQPQTQPAANE